MLDLTARDFYGTGHLGEVDPTLAEETCFGACSGDRRIVRWYCFSFGAVAERIWWLRRAMEASNLAEAYNLGEWRRESLISLGVGCDRGGVLFGAVQELGS